MRNPLDDVLDEFRARASADLQPDEVWMLIDPEAGEVVEVRQGRQGRREREASGVHPTTAGRDSIGDGGSSGGRDGKEEGE